MHARAHHCPRETYLPTYFPIKPSGQDLQRVPVCKQGSDTTPGGPPLLPRFGSDTGFSRLVSLAARLPPSTPPTYGVPLLATARAPADGIVNTLRSHAALASCCMCMLYVRPPSADRGWRLAGLT